MRLPLVRPGGSRQPLGSDSIRTRTRPAVTVVKYQLGTFILGAPRGPELPTPRHRLMTARM